MKGNHFTPDKCQVRSEGDGEQKKTYIAGRAIEFSRQSPFYGSGDEKWAEIIEPTALQSARMDDVVALFNHNQNFILGRSGAGNLSLTVDDKGLRYEVEVDGEITYVRDLLRAIARNDVQGSSFEFRLPDKSGSEWRDIGEGKFLHVIKSFEQIRDVSPVTRPFYPTTQVQTLQRSLSDFIEANTGKVHPVAIPAYREREYFILKNE